MGMSDADRRARVRAYKEEPRPAGVFCVRNTSTGRTLLGATPDLPGMLNRQRFQLEMGSHPDHDLQADWNRLGSAAFVFEVVDRLEHKDQSAEERAEDLRVLRQMWLERLQDSGTDLYPHSERR